MIECGQARRRQHGVAVLSLRRPWLTRQLQEVGVPLLHLIPQLGPALLPAFRPPLPLLLDTAAMPQSMLVTVLWELSRERPRMPTLALVAPHQPGLARLIALPLTMTVVLADTTPAATLGRWLRIAPRIARRSAAAPPAVVGLEPALGERLDLPAYTLDILRALAPYGGAPPASITAAAQHAGMSRRLFCYQLTALRAVVGLPATRRYRPPALAAAIGAALATGAADLHGHAAAAPVACVGAGRATGSGCDGASAGRGVCSQSSGTERPQPMAEPTLQKPPQENSAFRRARKCRQCDASAEID